jgi:eukaryotic-like serine/threonine-protein kinase
MYEPRMADRTSGPRLPDPFQGTAYQTVKRLGGGEAGELFVVEHLEIGRHFAAKVLHAHLAQVPQVADRLRLEGQALARLNHPNVVSVHGFDTTPEGRPFLIMELLRGRSLAQELAESGSMPLWRAAGYAKELLSALEAVHGIGVVHRDVQPSNVFLAESHDGSKTLKLLDFGIARVLESAPPEAPRPLSFPTQSGAVLGAARFRSPESAQGVPVDEQADLYGAALVIYTMLAGRGPFDHARGDQAVMLAHATENAAPPSRFAREPIPAELDALMLRALHKNPRARFASAREFREHLERLTALFASPPGFLETTQYERSDEPSPAQELSTGATALGLRARPPLSRKAIVIAVIIAISGMIASAIAVVGVATLLRGAR